MARYRLEVTEAQLRSLSLACEVCARFKIGQPGMALDMLRLQDREGKEFCDYEFEQLLDAIIKPRMGLDMNASWGVGKYQDADAWFDLYASFRHRLAWDRAIQDGLVKEGEPRNWRTMMGVDYDTPMKWGDQPLPAVAKIEEDQPGDANAGAE